MERIALVGGIILAIVVAISASFDDVIHVRFDDHDMDWGHTARAGFVEPAPGGTFAARTYAETEVRVVHAAAVVRVIPEDRTDVSVEMSNPGAAPMPVISQKDGRLEIDGRLARRIDECLEAGGADLEDYGELSRDQLPIITIRAPRDLDLAFHGAVLGEIGPSNSLDIALSGCGDTTAGDVAGALDVSNDGSGEFTVGAAASADVSLAGSGRVEIGAVSGETDVSVAGSGEVVLASARTDRLEVSSAGSGQVTVNGGEIDVAVVEIAGSGQVEIDAPVRLLDVSIAGSGDVSVSQDVGEVEASIMGSGDVNVARLTGSMSQSVMGSGTVNIAARGAPREPVAPSAQNQAPAP